MHEVIANIHIHTSYTDGSKLHREIAEVAMECDVDVLFFSDHNLYVNRLSRYFRKNGRSVLAIIGEEIHDQNRMPQKNHLLVFGIDRDFSKWAEDPQILVNKISQAHGLSFIAHPYDPALPAFHEGNISWVSWPITGLTGLEVWNGFSEMKVRSRSRFQAIFFAFFPQFLALKPPSQNLRIWDFLLKNNGKVVAVGGSDAHALNFRSGIFRKTLFPYQYHFRTINTHLLLDTPMTGSERQDRDLVLQALASGHCFIGNDSITPSRGFQFFTEDKNNKFTMGDEVKWKSRMRLKIDLPAPAECHLIHNGSLINKKWIKKNGSWDISETGYYRVECYRFHLFRNRGWIFSNPIYFR
jgi:hypothetical protein